MASKIASFAPYTPPPDDPSYASNTASTSKSNARAWFPTQGPSLKGPESSYQSGGIPTFDTSAAGGLGAVEEVEAGQNQWETRYGMRVDLLSAFAYLLGPISALALLITETHNDYIRFHGYQSALATTPLLILRILFSFLGFADFLCTFLSLLLASLCLFMAFQAFRGAAQGGLARYHLPFFGQIAEQWVSEE